jgi:hypothetical protein
MMFKMTKEVGSQKRKGEMQMWTEHEPLCTDLRLKVLRAEELNMGTCFFLLAIRITQIL